MTEPTDAVLDLLIPLWRAAIGGFVVLAVAVTAVRLARRGRSRMRTALLVTAAAVVALMVIGALATG